MESFKAMIKNLFLVILIIAILAGLYYYDKKYNKKIDSDDIELITGESHQLSPSCNINENDTIFYRSNDLEVAIVDEETGLVTATGIGFAQVAVTLSSDNSTCKIYNIVVSNERKTKTTKRNKTNKTNPNNKTTLPNATITTTPSDPGKPDNQIIMPSAIQIDKVSTTLNVGSSEKLSATIYPKNATDKKITWHSSNEYIAPVDMFGNVNAIKEGVATITATTSNGKKSSIRVNVIIPTIKVTGVDVSKQNSTINVGASDRVTATVYPNNASNKSVTWSSSNSNVATVDGNGNIKGINPGNATITVTTNDQSKTASVKVVVNALPTTTTTTKYNPATQRPTQTTATTRTTTTTRTTQKTTQTPTQPPTIAVTGVSLNKTSGTLYLNAKNKTVKLTATVSPSNATNKTVAWSSSNASIASVDSTGLVTAKALGTVTITATSGGKKATYTLNVKKKIIVVIGASQVTRMNNYVKSYSSSTMNYNVTSKDNTTTLKIIADSGTGFSYQTGNGWKSANTFINNYAASKNYIEFYVYFPMPGNDIKKFTCGEISKTNATIKGYMNNYNKVITNVKSSGYNVNAYVVSVHPVRPSEAPSGSAVVSNTNANSCKSTYRSNVKYYTFNKATKEILKSYSNLKYTETFTKIMKVNETGAAFSYKITYKTTDGVHWDEATTKKYMTLMLENNTSL